MCILLRFLHFFWQFEIFFVNSNMSKNFLFVGVGAALLLYLLSKKSAAKNLKIYFANLGTRKKKGSVFPDVIASFRIVNPTSSNLTIDSIAGDIYVNNNPLSSISNTESFTIPGQSESLYSVKITTTGFSVLQTVYNLLKDKSGKFNVRFDGTANSGGLLIPINETLYSK